MVNTRKLRGIMVEKGYSQKEISDALGIHFSTLYRKLKSGDDFTIGETNKLVEILSLSRDETLNIFFNNTVA